MFSKPGFSKLLLAILTLWLSSLIAMAQNARPLPALKSNIVSVETAVPDGWDLQTSAAGDLNHDGLPDKILVLTRDLGSLVDDGSVFALFLARQDGSYDLAANNGSAIPFSGMNAASSIRKNTLVLTENYMIGGAVVVDTYRFRFQDEKFFLIGVDSTVRHQGYYSFESLNYLTGELRYRSNHDERDNVGWIKRRFKPRLLSLQEIGEGGLGFVSNQICSHAKDLC
jgi:hypothetical protein